MSERDGILLNMTRDELRARGLNPTKVLNLVKRLNKCGKDLEELGLVMFGCSGRGELIQGEHLVENSIADISGNSRWDGGDY